MLPNQFSGRNLFLLIPGVALCDYGQRFASHLIARPQQAQMFIWGIAAELDCPKLD